ncbi:MAG: NADP-dependent oxidoreductase [Pseudomonas sp.]
MRAVVMNRLGNSQVLDLVTVGKPVPGPEEVLIRVHYAGVNPADWKCREGALSSFFTYEFPFVLGFDLSGIVESVGEQVTGFQPGDRVFAQSDVGMGKWGSYAEYARVSQGAVVRMPDSLGFAEAAAVPTPALAAWAGLFDDGGLGTGQTVLIHGGAGAVGVFAIQFAKTVGARVAVTCSGPNREYLHALGCDYSIDYQQQDIAAELRDWAPEGVDMVLDCVGCGTLPDALDMLRPEGVLVAILTLVAGDPGPDMTAAERRGLRTALTYSKLPSGPALAEVAELLAAGRVRPPRIDILPLEEVRNALDLLQSGKAKRKLVLAVRAEADLGSEQPTD